MHYSKKLVTQKVPHRKGFQEAERKNNSKTIYMYTGVQTLTLNNSSTVAVNVIAQWNGISIN